MTPIFCSFYIAVTSIKTAASESQISSSEAANKAKIAELQKQLKSKSRHYKHKIRDLEEAHQKALRSANAELEGAQRKLVACEKDLLCAVDETKKEQQEKEKALKEVRNLSNEKERLNGEISKLSQQASAVDDEQQKRQRLEQEVKSLREEFGRHRAASMEDVQKELRERVSGDGCVLGNNHFLLSIHYLLCRLQSLMRRCSNAATS